MEGEDVYDLPRKMRVALTEHYQPTELERMTEATAENPIELPPESPDDAAGQRRLLIEAVENVLASIRTAPLEVPITFMQAPCLSHVSKSGESYIVPTGVAFVIQYGEQRDVGFRLKSERPPELSGLVSVNGSPIVPGDV